MLFKIYIYLFFKVLAENMDLPPRIRFMLKDVIELREDKWVPRKATTVEGPMPMNQIRPADEDPRNAGYLMRDRRNQDRDSDRVGTNELFRSSMKMRRGIEDIMAGISIGSSSTNLIPTHNDKFNFNPNGFGVRDSSFRAHNNQRTGYNMYNNQRGTFNKHNQNNQHSNNNAQFNNASNKELAPRFKKNLIAAREQNLGDVELRPAANSMLFNQASIKAPPTNLVLNNRPAPELTLSTPATKPTPAPLMKEPLPIKQVTTEKPKQTKKDKVKLPVLLSNVRIVNVVTFQGPSKEELQKKLNSLVDEYLQENVTLSEALDSYKENKLPDKHAKDALINMFTTTVNTAGK